MLRSLFDVQKSMLSVKVQHRFFCLKGERKMKNGFKKLFALILVTMTLTTGCGKNVPTESGTSKAEISESTSQSVSVSSEDTKKDSHYPVTVKTYNYAREEINTVYEKAPEKVYVAFQNNIEMMLRLGLGDKIVACYGLDGEIAEDLKDEFARVNYLQQGLPKEDVVAMQPDFILGWSSLFGEKRLGDVDYWNKSGTNTYMSLNSGARPKGTPQKVEDEMQDILNIGKIFNVEDKAQALVDEVYAEIKKVEDYIKDKEKVSIAILEDESDSYRVYGANVLGGDIAVHAGAELKIGADNSKNISAEDLVISNPDAIFMVWYDGFLSPEEVVKSITENPAFASLNAVKNGRVYPINLTNIYCSGLRCKDGVLEFAKNLYPELYK